MLSCVTKHGFIFRVDMRLRPFGDSSSIIINFKALEKYFKLQGRDWERYAYLKADVITGSFHHKKYLSDIIKNFVYKSYNDYTVKASIRNMKLSIIKETNTKKLTNNIKLGAGGIREVEFMVQCLQLVYGGKNRLLQTQKLKKGFISTRPCWNFKKN